MKILTCALVVLLVCLLSCGRPKSTPTGKRPCFDNASSSDVSLTVVPRYHPAEILPGETMLDVP